MMRLGMLWGWLLMALCLCSCQRQDVRAEARKDLQTALAVREENADRSMELCRKGMEALEAGKYEEAADWLGKAVDAENRNVHAWQALGVANFKRGRPVDAGMAFHQASKFAPHRFEPHYNLGRVFESLGRDADAIDAYEAALALAPEQTEAMEDLARCYVRTGRKPERVRQLAAGALETERRPEWRQWLQSQVEAGGSGNVEMSPKVVPQP